MCGRGYNITLRKSRKKKLYLAIAIRKFAEVSVLIAFFIFSKKKNVRTGNKYPLHLLNILSLSILREICFTI